MREEKKKERKKNWKKDIKKVKFLALKGCCRKETKKRAIRFKFQLKRIEKTKYLDW